MTGAQPASSPVPHPDRQPRPRTHGGSAELGAATVLVAVPEGLRAEFFDRDALARLDAVADRLGGTVEWLDGGTALASPGVVRPAARVLVTCWGQPPLDAALLDRLPTLQLVAHTGASVRPFVTGELFARGVRVTQAGQGMARPVAEVALTFTLALLHQVPRFDHALAAGADWATAESAPPRHELLGSTIGVVGASRTGRANIALLTALGARVLVADPYLTDADALGVEAVELDELFRRSRIVVLHAPSLPETRHLVDARRLALMPDGAGLVNTARSWLVDEAALLAELRTGRIDAALDVFDAEPLPADHPLRALPNVLLTPHHAAGTVEGRLRQGRIVLAELDRAARGEPLEHAVTPDDLERVA
ncbi:hydroxyacid dehydrogenase [Cellulomonas denverensis]|uniref:Hydroxyacid dehydrogenase n=1 Tax=Cellulomonas denverensis TaxID=264297 RepID=A0A7X6R0A7_9CELL|nr:hydroxyacid dehydrogenase [Cellulomonas denverensis]NKY23977.1 hydroxyacid dehydrogenase [Cellulomonas denverensis]GIG24900.1 dehydrogenase [Cellulomonas denverensis]